MFQEIQSKFSFHTANNQVQIHSETVQEESEMIQTSNYSPLVLEQTEAMSTKQYQDCDEQRIILTPQSIPYNTTSSKAMNCVINDLNKTSISKIKFSFFTVKPEGLKRKISTTIEEESLQNIKTGMTLLPIPVFISKFLLCKKKQNISLNHMKWKSLANISDPQNLIQEFNRQMKFPNFKTPHYLQTHPDYKSQAILIVIWLIGRIAEQENPFPTAALDLAHDLWPEVKIKVDHRERDACSLLLFAALFLTKSQRGAARVLIAANKRSLKCAREAASKMKSLIAIENEVSIVQSLSDYTTSISISPSPFPINTEISCLGNISDNNSIKVISSSSQHLISLSKSTSYISETCSQSISISSASCVSSISKIKKTCSVPTSKQDSIYPYFSNLMSAAYNSLSTSFTKGSYIVSQTCSSITIFTPSTMPISNPYPNIHSNSTIFTQNALNDHFDYTVPNSIRIRGKWIGPSETMEDKCIEMLN